MKSTTNSNKPYNSMECYSKGRSKARRKRTTTGRKHEHGQLKGNREVDVLFQEADGVWLCMQGKDRPKGKKKRNESSHKLWRWRDKKVKDEYELYNKTACAGFHKSSNLKTMEAKVAKDIM